MRPADTDAIPELREDKSVPYGGGKEQELTHGGKVVKTKVGNFGGILGNSGYEDGVGKKIGAEGLAKYETDAENGNPKFSRFSKNHTKHVTRKQTKTTSLSQEIYQLDRKIPERVKAQCSKLY